MIIFISGGGKSGKSSHAEAFCKKLSKIKPPLYYIATMEPHDDEDLQRIARHRESRKDLGFETIEIGRDLHKIKEQNGSFLLDSLTALLANEMFLNDGTVVDNAAEKIIKYLDNLMNRNINIVFVSDYLYSDAEIFDEFTNNYRESLGKIDRHCAKRAEIVAQCVCGNLIYYKGGELVEKL